MLNLAGLSMHQGGLQLEGKLEFLGNSKNIVLGKETKHTSEKGSLWLDFPYLLQRLKKNSK